MSGFESPSRSSSKRIKLESDVEDEGPGNNDIGEELDGDHCSICLQLLLDRTVIPECSHEFCFDCIVIWTEQARRCPLCTRTIGPYLIHHIRSNYDYQKYHLPPLRSSPPPIQPLRRTRISSVHRRPGQERRWGRRERREQDVADELERAIDRRRWVYHNHLYAKHVASNAFTRYRPFPTPAQFSASQDYSSRATIFIRRELRVWVNLDVEFLTTFILSLMKAIDIRSESAIKLLAEFLDMDQPYGEGRRFPNAEHFAHELYSFLRSPYKSLAAYDVNVQYDVPERVHGRENHDNKTAPANRAINEVTPHRFRARHGSLEWSPLSDGDDQFGSKLKGQDTNDDIRLASSGTTKSARAEEHTTGDKIVSSTPLDMTQAVRPAGAYTPQVAGEQSQPSHPTSFNVIPACRSQVGVKGKGRVSTANDLETHATGGHGHIYKETLESPRSEGEAEICQTSDNVSADTGEILTLGQTDDSGGTQSYQNSAQSTQMHLRSRNSLLIAQAHLSEIRTKPKLKQPRLPSAQTEDARPDLRGSSQCDSKRPSLLSRITEPKPPEAHADTAAGSLSQPGPDISLRRDKFVQPVDADLRAKLVRRLEVERAAQAERERHSGDMKEASYSLAPQNTPSVLPPPPSASNSSDASSLAEGHEIADLEAKSRARARLRMKLTVAKHLHAPTSRTSRLDNADDRVSEENSSVPENREGMLRAVLENRRRGG